MNLCTPLSDKHNPVKANKRIIVFFPSKRSLLPVIIFQLIVAFLNKPVSFHLRTAMQLTKSLCWSPLFLVCLNFVTKYQLLMQTTHCNYVWFTSSASSPMEKNICRKEWARLSFCLETVLEIQQPLSEQQRNPCLLGLSCFGPECV